MIAFSSYTRTTLAGFPESSGSIPTHFTPSPCSIKTLGAALGLTTERSQISSQNPTLSYSTSSGRSSTFSDKRFQDKDVGIAREIEAHSVINRRVFIE